MGRSGIIRSRPSNRRSKRTEMEPRPGGSLLIRPALVTSAARRYRDQAELVGPLVLVPDHGPCQRCSSLSLAASRSRPRCSRWRVAWLMVPLSKRRASSAFSAALRSRRGARSITPSGSGARAPSMRARVYRSWPASWRGRGRSRHPRRIGCRRARRAGPAPPRPAAAGPRSAHGAAAGRAIPASLTSGFEGEPLHDERDHDDRGGEYQDQVAPRQRAPLAVVSGIDNAGSGSVAAGR